MKRFYTDAGIAAQGTEFQVTLDGKPLRTPARNPLVLPTQALAEAVAAEWASQCETIDKSTMPLTALACIAIDVASNRAAEMRQELANYATTDQLCYRESNRAMQEAQARLGDPLLHWAAERYGARLAVTDGIMPIGQSAAALDALTAALSDYDRWSLAALSLATGIARSLVIGLALTEGRIEAGQAYALAALEEEMQAEQWGMDPVQRARLDAWKRDLDAIERFLALRRD